MKTLFGVHAQVSLKKPLRVLRPQGTGYSNVFRLVCAVRKPLKNMPTEATAQVMFWETYETDQCIVHVAAMLFLL